MTIEEYAAQLVADGATDAAEGDLNVGGHIADADHEAACDLALAVAEAIRGDPAGAAAFARERGTVRH